MYLPRFATCLSALLALAVGGKAIAQAGASSQSLYQIGNSFTQDSQPRGIQALATNAGEELDVGFHIRCGSSATGIVNNPTSNCVSPNSFGLFSEALPNNAWDHIAIQSHRSEEITLANEIDAITSLIDLAQTNSANADAELYLYQGWAFRSGANGPEHWESPIPESIDQLVTQRRDYFLRLHDEIEAEGHDLTIIPAGDVVYRVFTEIEAGNIEGLTDRDDLYRDGRHLTGNVGRFIAGTTVLTTILGRDLTGVEKPDDYYGLNEDLPDALRDTLQSIVWDVVRNHPEAGLLDQLMIGDYDFDGQVGVDDLDIWRSDFGSTTRQSADGNRDYSISAADYTILRDFIQPAAVAAASIAVPEPSAAVVAATAAATLLRRRRSGRPAA